MGGGRFGNAGRMIVQGVSRTPGVARPGSAQTAGVPQPRPAVQVPQVSASAEPLGIGPAESGSVYFLLYRYYIPSEQNVFLEIGNWEERRRFAEFQRVMKTRMQADYSLREAEVVCRIFNLDMRLMFYEKAIQELRERRKEMRLAEESAEYLSKGYSKKLAAAKQQFYYRKKAVPPANFGADALWFATFSGSSLDGCFPGGKEHVGSIYFDGGRIRLMHSHGPEISRRDMVRILRAEQRIREPERRILTKEDDVLELAKLVAAAKKQYPGEETLYEYGGGWNHPSRGYPKKIVLNNSELAQLYYVVNRLDEVRIDGRVDDAAAIRAGNKLLIQFLRCNARLRQELGYEGLI